jgi:hypothetical protein
MRTSLSRNSPPVPDPSPVTVRVTDESTVFAGIVTVADDRTEGRVKFPVLPVSLRIVIFQVESAQATVSLFVIVSV